MTALPDHSPFHSAFRGDGPRIGVVLSHGFTGSPHGLRAWAASLAEAGFAVRMPLLPGHGTTWQELARTRWTQWHGALDDAYLELDAECDHVFSAGLSMGGALALRVAATRPVAGVILVNPGLVIDDPRAPLAGILKLVLKSTPAIANDILKAGMDEGAYPGPRWLPPMSSTRCSRTPSGFSPGHGARTCFQVHGGPCGVRLQHRCLAPRPHQRHVAADQFGEQLPRGHPGQRRGPDLRRLNRVHPVGHPGVGAGRRKQHRTCPPGARHEPGGHRP